MVGWDWFVLLLITGLTLAQGILLLTKLGFRYGDEDQFLMWYMAKEFMAGYFREPCFPGQAYSTAMESLLAVPFMWLGMPVQEAVPLAASFWHSFCLSLLGGPCLSTGVFGHSPNSDGHSFFA